MVFTLPSLPSSFFLVLRIKGKAAQALREKSWMAQGDTDATLNMHHTCLSELPRHLQGNDFGQVFYHSYAILWKYSKTLQKGKMAPFPT